MRTYITRGRQADLANPFRGEVFRCPECGGVLDLVQDTTIVENGVEHIGDMSACSECEWALELHVARPVHKSVPSTVTHFIPYDQPGRLRAGAIRKAACGILIVNRAHTNEPTCLDCQAAMKRVDEMEF